MFGSLFFVVVLGWGISIIAGALALTMFNIPILVRTIQQALEDVPASQRDASLAMGLTRWETTINVLLPAAMPAIVTGIVISAGRVFGEAAALIFTSGSAAARLNFASTNLAAPTNPWNIFRPAETLAVHIWKLKMEPTPGNDEIVWVLRPYCLCVCCSLTCWHVCWVRFLLGADSRMTTQNQTPAVKDCLLSTHDVTVKYDFTHEALHPTLNFEGTGYCSYRSFWLWQINVSALP